MEKSIEGRKSLAKNKVIYFMNGKMKLLWAEHTASRTDETRFGRKVVPAEQIF